MTIDDFRKKTYDLLSYVGADLQYLDSAEGQVMSAGEWERKRNNLIGQIKILNWSLTQINEVIDSHDAVQTP